MTSDKLDVEASRHVRAYATQVKKMNCLRRRMSIIAQTLTEFSQALEIRYNLSDELGEIGTASREIGSVDLQADLKQLMSTLEERTWLESALIDHDLGALISRP